MIRFRRAATRWLGVLSLAIFGAFAFHLILPPVWHGIRAVQLPYSPGFVKVITLLVTFLLFYFLLEPIRVRRGQWSTLGWYPPLWVALVLAVALAAWMDRLPVDVRPSSLRPQWQQPYVVLPILIVFLAAVLLRQLPRRVQLARDVDATCTDAGRSSVAPTPSHIYDWYSSSERPIATARQDLFRRAPLADRIAITLQDGLSVALLGGLGAGKSSVLNIVRETLARGTTTTVVASLDLWAVPRPQDVPRVALDRVIDALDQYVDTLPLRNLSATYQHLVAALPLRNIPAVLRLHTHRDALAELRRLVPVLEVLNAQLVLIVEDAERTTKEFDTRHLQRLLWALRTLPRVAFVLACDPDHGPSIDYAKLCDTIELLRPMSRDDVARVLTAAIHHWRRAYLVIDPGSGARDSTLGLEGGEPGGLQGFLRAITLDTPVNDLSRLLQTPRALRAVLRRADRIWRHLHGEANLEQIIVLTALREAATSAYEFLVTHIDAARYPSDSLLDPTPTLTEDWNRVVEALPNGRAARQLVNRLNIPRLSEDRTGGPARMTQGIHLSEPVDYFRRILAERLDVEEIRDQTVLKDIDAWRQGHSGPLVERLLAASDEDGRYVQIWFHFAGRLATSELAQLTSLLVEQLLDRDREEATAHPALIALFEAYHDGLRDGVGGDHESMEWLRNAIVRAVPVNLGLATELCLWWNAEDGLLRAELKRGIRQAFVEAIHEALRNGANLGALWSRRNPYGVYELILGLAKGDDGVPLNTWRQHFAPGLVLAARAHPEVILPELANLLGDDESTKQVAGTEPPTFIGRYGIDRERAEAVLGEVLDDALSLLAEYEGESIYVVRARDSARAWLKERQGVDGEPREPTGTGRADPSAGRSSHSKLGPISEA